MGSRALIGGTGLNQLPGLEIVAEHDLTTPWGKPSHPIREGVLEGSKLYFIARHGIPHSIAPHRINYRANVWSLKELGVCEVVAVNAVGAIPATMPPGHLVLPDQLIDYSWGREGSFFDGVERPLGHIDFTEPYDSELRARLAAAAERLGLAYSGAATYACTQGPRLETAAEVRRLQQDGCDLVGMTGMPEAALAREAGLAYAAICMVVNPAAGLSSEPITEEAIHAVLEQESHLVAQLIRGYLAG